MNLFEVLENPKGHLIAVDMDGTLCKEICFNPQEMINATPNKRMVSLVLRWYLAGAYIVIYTARPPKFYRQTHAWLILHSIAFHGICMQMKPSASIYIDDKVLNVSDILEIDFEKKEEL